jgi:hypothetical protein
MTRMAIGYRRRLLSSDPARAGSLHTGDRVPDPLVQYHRSDGDG